MIRGGGGGVGHEIENDGQRSSNLASHPRSSYHLIRLGSQPVQC